MTRVNKLLRLMLPLAVGGTCLQINNCSPSSVGRFFNQLNPCITLVTCDPVAYEFFRSGYEGPGVDTDVDIFCTYPPFCADDPLFGGLNP